MLAHGTIYISDGNPGEVEMERLDGCVRILVDDGEGHAAEKIISENDFFGTMNLMYLKSEVKKLVNAASPRRK